MRIVVVVMAHDEAEVLVETLAALRRASPAPDEVHVVADRCRDDTAGVARIAGAIVHVRAAGRGGKGRALHWWVERTRRRGQPNDVVLVLDADSMIDERMIGELRTVFRRGADAVQSYVKPVLSSDHPIARLGALSENLDQQGGDRLRRLIGWSSRLRGTGMAFRRSILQDVSGSLRTVTEDAELSLLLAGRGVTILWVPNATVFDPKPAGYEGMQRQRARWLQGQAQIVREHPALLVRLMSQGPPAWSLITAVLLRPKALFIPLKALSLALALAAAIQYDSPLLPLVVASLSLALIGDALMFLVGMHHISDRRGALRTLAWGPLYFGMWLGSILLSISRRGVWLRARPRAQEDVAVKARSIP